MQQWEYVTTFYKNLWPHEEQLNKLGAEGWELVAAPFIVDENGDLLGELIFKRSKQRDSKDETQTDARNG